SSPSTACSTTIPGGTTSTASSSKVRSTSPSNRNAWPSPTSASSACAASTSNAAAYPTVSKSASTIPTPSAPSKSPATPGSNTKKPLQKRNRADPQNRFQARSRAPHLKTHQQRHPPLPPHPPQRTRLARLVPWGLAHFCGVRGAKMCLSPSLGSASKLNLNPV